MKPQTIQDISTKIEQVKDELQSLGFDPNITQVDSLKLVDQLISLLDNLQESVEKYNETAQELSAPFDAHYEEAKKEKWKNILWLLGAIVFIYGAMTAGLNYEFMISTWTNFISDKNNPPNVSGFDFALGRVALMATAFSAAWFSASQYVRAKNTLDDYAYKSTLAKSIMPFLDLLKDEEKVEFLQFISEQLYQDPLRKNHDVEVPMSRIAKMFGRKNRNKE